MLSVWVRRFVMKKSPAKIDKEYYAIGVDIIKTKSTNFRKTSYTPDEKVGSSPFTTVRDLSFEVCIPPFIRFM